MEYLRLRNIPRKFPLLKTRATRFPPAGLFKISNFYLYPSTLSEEKLSFLCWWNFVACKTICSCLLDNIWPFRSLDSWINMRMKKFIFANKHRFIRPTSFPFETAFNMCGKFVAKSIYMKNWRKPNNMKRESTRNLPFPLYINLIIKPFSASYEFS